MKDEHKVGFDTNSISLVSFLFYYPFQSYIHFHIASPSTPWSRLFQVMENARVEMEWLEEYSVSQTTLEQVFLAFAKKQAGTGQ